MGESPARAFSRRPFRPVPRSAPLSPPPCPLPPPGPTGSGKTHTLFGGGDGTPGSEGVIARAVARLGAGLGAAAAASASSPLTPAPATPSAPAAALPPSTASLPQSPSVSVSVVEVYCDRVYCLLSPVRPEVTLTAGGHGDGGGVGLAGAAAPAATSPAGLAAHIAAGAAARAVGSTAANARSSRSHCVVFIRVSPGAGAPPAVLALADLAGSERVAKAQTAAGTAAFDEGRAINQSLAALGNVIAALTTAAPAGAAGEAGPAVGAGAAPSLPTHIPYRASKLTRLLQGVIGVAASTSFLVCASAAGADAKETLCALRFGVRARGVVAGVVADVGASVPGSVNGGPGADLAYAASARRAVAAAAADAAATRVDLAKERAGRAADAAAARAADWALRKQICLAGMALAAALDVWVVCGGWRCLRGCGSVV